MVDIKKNSIKCLCDINLALYTFLLNKEKKKHYYQVNMNILERVDIKEFSLIYQHFRPFAYYSFT